MVETELTQLQADALVRIQSAATPEELESVRIEILGRKGSLAQARKVIPTLGPEEKAAFGKVLNGVTQALDLAFESRKAAFEAEALARRLDSEWVDLTLPAPGTRPGSLHPVTQLQHEIGEVFTSMGFTILDGPEVETEYNNFDALNIPPDHPARDMQDTFWLEGGNLLRTHTSPVQ